MIALNTLPAVFLAERHELVRVEAAALDQVQAKRIEQLLIAQVGGGVEGGDLLLLAQLDAAVPGRVAERDLVGGAGELHAGDAAQQAEVGVGQCLRIVVAADAGQLHAHDLVFGQAAGAVHALKTIADEEQRVADDGAAERDLDHDQRRGSLVPAQGGEDGADFHGGLPGKVHWSGRRREAPRPAGSAENGYWDLSCRAGATWQARQAGNKPASRLAISARAKVVASIAGSRCANSA